MRAMQRREGFATEGEREPARDLTAARPNCKSRSAPYHTPHGSRRATDRAPDGSLTETGRKTAGRSTSRPRQGAVKEHLIVTLTVRRTLGVMTPAGVYAEDMPNGRRFKCVFMIGTCLFKVGKAGERGKVLALDAIT
ncbi:hypothetical protein Bbelb_337380 [Branchiostoma belcheri]|nr:hypothetical protein Bbelb_337380 [Branchiostoma belcheri]